MNLLLQSSIRKPGSSSLLILGQFPWCFHKQEVLCFIAMQPYKEHFNIVLMLISS
jgi:hypothetical protein